MSSARANNGLLCKKDIAALQRESKGEKDFRRTLGVWSLTAIGVGAIVGVRAFVLLGVATATEAGPPVRFRSSPQVLRPRPPHYATRNSLA